MVKGNQNREPVAPGFFFWGGAFFTSNWGANSLKDTPEKGTHVQFWSTQHLPARWNATHVKSMDHAKHGTSAAAEGCWVSLVDSYCGWTRSIPHHCSETLVSDSIPRRKYHTSKQWFQPWFHSGASFRPSTVFLATIKGFQDVN